MTGLEQVPGMREVALRHVTSLPTNLPGGISVGPGIEAAPAALMVSLAGAGRGLAQAGSSLEFLRAQDADPDLVTCLLSQSLRAALIQQRGDIALNGAALIGPHGKAIVLCGLSGVGKSVLAYALAQRGWRLLADGIAHVEITDGRPRLIPSDDTVRLWKDACENLGVDEAGLARVRAALAKFLVPVASSQEAAPLGCVVECVQSSQPALSQVFGQGAGAVLSRNSFRPRQIRAMGLTSAHIHAMECVLAVAPVFRLSGTGQRSPFELADVLMGLPL